MTSLVWNFVIFLFLVGLHPYTFFYSGFYSFMNSISVMLGLILELLAYSSHYWFHRCWFAEEGMNAILIYLYFLAWKYSSQVDHILIFFQADFSFFLLQLDALLSSDFLPLKFFQPRYSLDTSRVNEPELSLILPFISVI